MDINMTSSVSLAQGASDSVGISVLKKAISMQADTALALINAIPQPPQSASNLPPNLGQNINTTA